MSIIAHLVQVTTQQLRLFKSNPEEAYALILGSSKPAVKNAAQEIAAWKFRNAGTLLQVIRAGGRVENLNPVEKLAFEKAHSQFHAISRGLVEQAIASRIARPKSQRREISLEKAWQGIHFLLTGLAEGGKPPLAWAVHGDSQIPDREGLMPYGPARILTPQQASSVSKAIAPITQKELRKRFDPKALVASGVHPVNAATDFAYLWSHFTALKSFYAQATKQKCGILSYID